MGLAIEGGPEAKRWARPNGLEGAIGSRCVAAGSTGAVVD